MVQATTETADQIITDQATMETVDQIITDQTTMETVNQIIMDQATMETADQIIMDQITMEHQQTMAKILAQKEVILQEIKQHLQANYHMQVWQKVQQ